MKWLNFLKPTDNIGKLKAEEKFKATNSIFGSAQQLRMLEMTQKKSDPTSTGKSLTTRKVWVGTLWRQAALVEQLCHLIGGQRSELACPHSGPNNGTNALPITPLASLSHAYFRSEITVHTLV